MTIIKDGIEYLEDSINKFTRYTELMQATTNPKEIKKFNELRYDVMSDTKDYLKDSNLCEFGFISDNPKPLLDGLINHTYFIKTITGFVNNLKTKL